MRISNGCNNLEPFKHVRINKIVKLRLFDSVDRQWAKNVVDLNYEILSVSQFTLYSSTSKGSKPDFHTSMKTDEARSMYSKFLVDLKLVYPKVQDGEFGAMMDVELINDGPVTIILDSHSK